MEPILFSENLCQGKSNLENLNLFVIFVVETAVVMISCFISESYSMQKRGGVKLKPDLDILGKTVKLLQSLAM